MAARIVAAPNLRLLHKIGVNTIDLKATRPREIVVCSTPGANTQAVADPDNPLLRLAHVALLPHAAWLTPQTFARSLGVAVANGRCLPDGGAFRHRVA